MSFKITVLCENTVAKPGLIGEHGFAAYVETPHGNLLFDTGQGLALTPNAVALKKDLTRVSHVVLSHGHYDHTGGLLAFLGVHGPCDVVAHPQVLGERFWVLPDRDEQDPLSIGMPWHESYLTTRGASFRWVSTFQEVLPHVFVTGEVPRNTDFELGDPRMKVRRGGEWEADPFLDDYSLVLKTNLGLVVVLGCAHAGLINILEHAIRRTREPRIHAILGGTHLGFYPPEHLDRTMKILGEYDVDRLAVSHCTGQVAAARLAAEMGDRFAFGHVGFELAVN